MNAFTHRAAGHPLPGTPLPPANFPRWWALFQWSHLSTQLPLSAGIYEGLLPGAQTPELGGAGSRRQEPIGANQKGAGTHLASAAVHDVLRGVINLGLHVNILVLLMIHLHPQNSKGRPAKIQGDEISLFCLGRQQGSHQGHM